MYEYQYSVADHQGNTRAIITSVTPAAMDITATFEGNSADNKNQFSNVSGIVTSTAANHTSGGNKVIRMNQNYKVGPGKSIKVYPGDLVDTEVWTYYEATTGYGTSSPTVAAMVTAIAAAFGGASGGGGESGSIYDGVNSALGVFGLGGNAGNTAPAAYLNYILYDQQYKVLDMGWTIVPTSANFAKVKITLPQLTIKEAGFVFVYLSYEDQSNNYVYFDDFRVTHTKSNIIQASEYYPFGMQTANSWTRESVTANNFLGNGGTELNQTSQLYDLEFRNYDPTLGRMYGVDPVAGKYSSLTPYNYSFNNPVNENDPSGADPYPTSSNSNLWYNNGAGAYGYPGLSYDDYVPPIGNGQFFAPVSSFYGWASGNSGEGNMGAGWRPGQGGIASIIANWNPDFGGPIRVRTGGTDEKPEYTFMSPSSIEGYLRRERWNQTHADGDAALNWAYNAVINSGDNLIGGWNRSTNKAYASNYELHQLRIKPDPSSLTASIKRGPGDPNPKKPAGHNASDWYNTTLGSILNFTSITLIGEKSLEAARASVGLNIAGLVVTAITIGKEGLSTSSALDGIAGLVSFTPAAPLSLAYFGVNLWYLGTTGKSIGENIDEKYQVVPHPGGLGVILIPKN